MIVGEMLAKKLTQETLMRADVVRPLQCKAFTGEPMS